LHISITVTVIVRLKC